MNRIKLVILLVFCVCFSIVSIAQNKIDSTYVFFNAKMRLLEYAFNDTYDTNSLIGFIRYSPDVKILRSTGFEDSQIFFFEIHASPHVDTTWKLNVLNNTYGNLVYFGNIDYKFIFGYNITNKTIYLLNDFYQDDFRKFKSHFRQICLENYSIEGLDIKCMCRKLHKQKINCFGYPYIYDGVTW